MAEKVGGPRPSGPLILTTALNLDFTSLGVPENPLKLDYGCQATVLKTSTYLLENFAHFEKNT